MDAQRRRPASSLLPIEVVPDLEDVVTVFVRGEVDLVEAGELRAVLADACAGDRTGR